jgi:hypothetical protein
MNKFNYINRNLARIKREVKIGLIPTTVLSHYAVYSRFDYYRRLGNYVGISVLFASDSCKVSERTVFKIVKDMEDEV